MAPQVVEAVELQSGQASVLFATELSASIAVALHGINFQRPGQETSVFESV